jgi:hypothetical protein
LCFVGAEYLTDDDIITLADLAFQLRRRHLKAVKDGGKAA